MLLLILLYVLGIFISTAVLLKDSKTDRMLTDVIVGLIISIFWPALLVFGTTIWLLKKTQK